MTTAILEKQISKEEAEKLLTAECGRDNDMNIFDVFGNYNYPFETKLTTPNTAVGYIEKNL